MIELGLQRMSRLMADRPMPWRAIHVAGTNGKGSVCAFISDMLNVWNKSEWRRECGLPILRHGRFTSPFLVDPWDCISLSNTKHKMAPIDSKEYRSIMQEVVTRNEKHNIHATSFELLTATAFETFTRAHIDVAVVEVGMGGRLDSTNIIGLPVLDGGESHNNIDLATFRPQPLVSVITKIGLDHMGFLGNTIEEIAGEKAGIIKPKVPVVYDGTNEPSVCQVIEAVAQRNSSTAYPLHERSPSPISNDATKGAQDMLKPDSDYTVNSGAPQHQMQNSRVALEATLRALQSLGMRTNDPYSESFLALMKEMQQVRLHTKFPGRQEQINLSPILGLHAPLPAILDGAHNAQSANALADFLQTRQTPHDKPSHHGRRPTTWILAASDSKDMSSILHPLLHRGDAVFAVEFGPVETMEWVKPMSSATILSLAEQAVPGLAATRDFGRDIRAALEAAAATAPENEIVITGSLYLVGDVHRLLRQYGEMAED